jgi:hypothetical protein
MIGFMRICLLVIMLGGLCSCVHQPPDHLEDYATFVYVAAVHNVPFDGEPRPSAWHHVRGILDAAGIRNFMEASAGVASVSVEPNRTREAVDLIRKDAVAKGYWFDIAKAFR